VETLEHFQAELPGADLHLILGSDSLADIQSWRRWRELPRLARLVVLTRPGSEDALRPQTLAAPLRAAWETGRVFLVEHDPVAVSATELREIIARGEQPPAGSIHPLVLDYARKYRLYDETSAR
jgi:nicotinate-nucleotide adenylyltransferase